MTDGDKGDVAVSSDGDSWVIDASGRTALAASPELGAAFAPLPAGAAAVGDLLEVIDDDPLTLDWVTPEAVTAADVPATPSGSLAGDTVEEQLVELDTEKASATTIPVTDVTGTSDTIAAGDLGKILRYTDAGLVTVTLPDGIAVGSTVELLAWGAAGLAVQDNGTSTVQQEGAIAQYEAVSCVVVATNTWSVVGPLT